MVIRPARPTAITMITERSHHGDSGDSSTTLPGCGASLMVLSPDKDGQRQHNVSASRHKIKERATDALENRRFGHCRALGCGTRLPCCKPAKARRALSHENIGSRYVLEGAYRGVKVRADTYVEKGVRGLKNTCQTYNMYIKYILYALCSAPAFTYIIDR